MVAEQFVVESRAPFGRICQRSLIGAYFNGRFGHVGIIYQVEGEIVESRGIAMLILHLACLGVLAESNVVLTLFQINQHLALGHEIIFLLPPAVRALKKPYICWHLFINLNRNPTALGCGETYVHHIHTILGDINLITEITSVLADIAAFFP